LRFQGDGLAVVGQVPIRGVEGEESEAINHATAKLEGICQLIGLYCCWARCARGRT
jgi:hypothetical protein